MIIHTIRRNTHTHTRVIQIQITRNIMITKQNHINKHTRNNTTNHNTYNQPWKVHTNNNTDNTNTN